MLIDTHAHLYYDQFKPDFNEVIKHARDAGIETIINIGADLEGSQAAANLESSGISFFSTIGLHPHEVSKLSTPESIRKYIDKLEEIYQSHTNKIVAVGECGLDYFAGNNIDSSAPFSSQIKQAQKELFVGQIQLAKKLSLPLIIHCRDNASTNSAPSAWENIFVPELQGTLGVFHSFTGSLQIAQKILDMGYYLGLTCPVTYPKNDYLRQIIKDAPLDKLLTETDSPYLPPQNMRGERNEPANVIEVVRVIAEVKELSFKEVAQKTYINAKRLFQIAQIQRL